MDITTMIQLLSDCNLGAIILKNDYHISQINDTGKMLLELDDDCDVLPMRFHSLCNGLDHTDYIPVGFHRYVRLHPAPSTDCIPADCTLIVFRDATSDYELEIMKSICNHSKEGIIICDEASRIMYMNDPAMRMDMLTESAILGKTVAEIYHMKDESLELPLPKALENKTPRLNYRQQYVTRDGREVQAIANTWPVIKDNQLLGAFNLLEDSRAMNKLQQQVIELQEQLKQQTSKTSVKNSFKTKYTFDDIICIDKNMVFTIAQCRQVARTDSSVMIYGETGTGKELFAQSIHHASRRSNKPFLAINCAALPDNLLESILFGSVKGAYTGAENRTGLFEQANGGTLLLDEINSMNITLQAKLLRVLQEGVIRPLGGDKEIKVDVRILSCINVSPQQAISEGNLRQDLFYRLGVVNIMIPPLRNRKDDIPHLVKHFIWQYNQKLYTHALDVSPEVAEIFQKYRWPGNVRELQHAIEHALNVIPDDASVITMSHIPQLILEDIKSISASPSNAFISHKSIQGIEPASLGSYLHDVEYDSIIKALQDTRGNISQASKHLNMSRQNLQYRIKRYKISIEEFRK